MDAATERLVEKVGLRFEADGLSRTAGRILGLLLLSPEARSLDELAGALRVSKAGVSSNARVLESAGAIERVTHPGDRRDYYRVAENFHIRLLNHWLRSLHDFEALLTGALGETGVAEDAVVRGRLEAFAAFFELMLAEIRAAGDRWAAGAAPRVVVGGVPAGAASAGRTTTGAARSAGAPSEKSPSGVSGGLGVAESPGAKRRRMALES